jgi:hypothetical protein
MATASPRWAIDDGLRRARVATRLVRDYSDAIVPRLAPGLLDQLLLDRQLLGDTRDVEPLRAQKTATVSERETAADAHDLVMAIREAVKRSRNGSATLRAAVGVGDNLRATDTRRVVAALRSIGKYREGVLACGVAAADLDDAEALAVALQGADELQDEKIDVRASSTEQRVDAQLRMEDAIDDIDTAGVLSFRKNAAVRARFERLVSSSGPTKEDEAPLDPPVPT